MKKANPRSAFPKKKATSGAMPKKGPGRPRLAGESTYMRLDEETLRRVAKRKEALQKSSLVDLSQSDVLRVLIDNGLDLAEGKQAAIVAASKAAKTMERAIEFLGEMTEEWTSAVLLRDELQERVEALFAAGVGTRKGKQ